MYTYPLGFIIIMMSLYTRQKRDCCLRKAIRALGVIIFAVNFVIGRG
jgi:hypothetical protein